ncbi:hypothetical protein C8Q74DRAFT_1334985 [Fomes fomentarius]|nr:hypothetical protein C8Q74DRAFT_1334985 [Fomes fomentarius]
MAAHAARLAHLLTPEFACRINAQIVHPSISKLVKPSELESALARPLTVAMQEPNCHATYLAASLSYGIIQGHPFLDGNKRTAFLLANEYLRAQGLPGVLDEGKIGTVYQGLIDIADRHMNAAVGKLDDNGGGLARNVGAAKSEP